MLPLSLALPEENLKPWVRCSPVGQAEISALCICSGGMLNFPRKNLIQKPLVSFWEEQYFSVGFSTQMSVGWG